MTGAAALDSNCACDVSAAEGSCDPGCGCGCHTPWSRRAEANAGADIAPKTGDASTGRLHALEAIALAYRQEAQRHHLRDHSQWSPEFAVTDCAATICRTARVLLNRLDAAQAAEQARPRTAEAPDVEPWVMAQVGLSTCGKCGRGSSLTPRGWMGCVGCRFATTNCVCPPLGAAGANDDYCPVCGTSVMATYGCRHGGPATTKRTEDAA